MQAVEDICFGGAAVEVEEEEVDVRVELAHLLFDAFGDDVVGDAGEGLQADDVFHAFFGQRGHLRGDEPAFAEISRHIDDAGG